MVQFRKAITSKFAFDVIMLVYKLFIICTLLYICSLTIEQFLMHPYPGCTMFSISMQPLLLPNPEGVQFMMPPNPEGVQFMMPPNPEGVQFMMPPNPEGVQFFDANLVDFLLQKSEISLLSYKNRFLVIKNKNCMEI